MKKIHSVPFILIALMFAFQNAFGAVLLDRVVATVNDEVITWSELMNMIVLEGKNILSGLTGKEREDKIEELQGPFLNNFIEMKLQLQEAKRMGLDVSDKEINGAINEIKRKYDLTDENLLNSLAAEGISMAEYRESLSEQILVQKSMNLAVRSNIVISDKEIEQYYKDNRGRFESEEKARIRQIFFAMPEDESNKKAVESKAQELIHRIKSGEDFAKLAEEYSEDPSGKFGGDLGYIIRGSVLKEIEDEAFSLKTGEVSNPFWSSAGLHIIKVEERTEVGGIEKVRENIKDILFQKAFESKYHEWRTELREKAYIEIKL